jgi:hypothetical protein
MITLDLDDLKSRINPQYATTPGMESYERRLCVEEIEALRAQVAELARWKSTNAPRIEALEGLKEHYSVLADQGVEAIKTLASEREANAILTAENEALRARVAELEKDASRYRWLRDIQKCWDFADSMFLNCSSEEHDAAIDAARGEG